MFRLSHSNRIRGLIHFTNKDNAVFDCLMRLWFTHTDNVSSHSIGCQLLNPTYQNTCTLIVDVTRVTPEASQGAEGEIIMLPHDARQDSTLPGRQKEGKGSRVNEKRRKG